MIINGAEVIIKDTRDPQKWGPRLKAFEVPTRWPKGQTVMDRLYWCSMALLQVEYGTPEYRRVDSLFSQALGLLY